MSQRSSRTQAKPSLEVLEGKLLLSTSHPSAPHPTAQLYLVEFLPLNGSGITGRGTMVQSRTSGTDSETAVDSITLSVAGLERGQAHVISLTGFTGSPARAAVIPPDAASTLDPSPAGLGPAVISQSEGSPFYGATRVAITPIPGTPRPGPRTFGATFRDKFDAQSPMPLGELVVLRGMTVHGKYESTVPVAVGVIRPFSGRKL